MEKQITFDDMPILAASFLQTITDFQKEHAINFNDAPEEKFEELWQSAYKQAIISAEELSALNNSDNTQLIFTNSKQLSEKLSRLIKYTEEMVAVFSKRKDDTINGYRVQQFIELLIEYYHKTTNALPILERQLKTHARPQESSTTSNPKPQPHNPEPSIIKTAQENLKSIGFFNGKIDGVLSNETSFAISNFQERYKLPVTGGLDTGTAELIAQIALENRSRKNVNNISSKIEKFAQSFLSAINALTLKHNKWYAFANTKEEEAFGNSISILIERCQNISANANLSYLEIQPIHDELSSLLSIITTLEKAYSEKSDLNVLTEFKDFFLWAQSNCARFVTETDVPDADLTYPLTADKSYSETSEPEPEAWLESQPPPTQNKKPEIQNPQPSKPASPFGGQAALKTLTGRLLSDQATQNDLLGFSVYATAVAQMIKKNIDEQKTIAGQPADKKQETKAGKPFNIGIIAPWGHGKTTLMKNILRELDPNFKSNDLDIKKDIKEKDGKASTKHTTYKQAFQYLHGSKLKSNSCISDPFPSVWFNAWRYQSSEQIWAGLGHAIITQLSSRLTPPEQEKFWFKLQLSRVDVLRMRKEFYSDIIKKSLPFVIACSATLVFSIYSFASEFNWKISTLFAGISFVSGITGFFKSSKEKIDGKVSVHFNEPDYSGKLGVYHHIINDLHKVFSLLLSENQRAVIFIDDLDRCSPTVIAEVFEAVNLMMVDPIIGNHCYFIFGMDAQVVAAALDNKYANMTGKLKDQEDVFGSVGWYFLDKFIQLPFNVPIMSDDDRLTFLRFFMEEEKPAAVAQKPEPDKQNIEKINAEVKKAMSVDDPQLKKQNLANVLNSIDDKDTELKREAVKTATIEKLSEEDSTEIIEQLKFISPYLSSSPREIIRYINLLRFYNASLFIRQSDNPGIEILDFKAIAKYLLVALKWPQLVRWIQWEGDEEIVIYNTTRQKAHFLDNLIADFAKDGPNKKAYEKYTTEKYKPDPSETEQQQATDTLFTHWSTWCDSKLSKTNATPIPDDKKPPPKKLPWLYDKQIMEVLFHKDTTQATFQKALASRIW